ncbi:hypothetical protein [Kineococcus sp. G2]|uniref:hypothetical protein n=1 Tax=Kineococcus sp. G2 TaxID=3127484 RepID=UPI00301CDC3C
MVHRRDSIDRLHVGTPHRVDLWRIVSTSDDAPGAGPTSLPGPGELRQVIALLVQAVPPGAQWRTAPAVPPCTRAGLQVDVRTPAGWVELAECGLIAEHVLATTRHEDLPTGGAGTAGDSARSGQRAAAPPGRHLDR